MIKIKKIEADAHILSSDLHEIQIDIVFPKEYDSKTKTILEKAAYNCPVHHTLSETVEKNISFTYTS